MCALLRNSVSVLSLHLLNGRLLRVTLCLNVFVLLCWGRQGLQARVLQKYYGLIFFWNGWSFFEVATHCNEWASLHQDDLRSCEQSSVEIIIFLSPLPPLQGCSWVMTSLLHLAGTLRIMSWLGMSHHSGNPVCVEAIAHHKSHQLTVFS